MTDAILIGGHHDYLVTGKTFNRKFECMKRFREFHALHQHLKHIWPGIYIPPVPKKVFFVIL